MTRHYLLLLAFWDLNEKLQHYDTIIIKYMNEIDGLQQSEHQSRKRLQSLEVKIREFKRYKSKVQFMRFLRDKLPLPVIVAKKADIPEVDILLKAFGL